MNSDQAGASEASSWLPTTMAALGRLHCGQSPPSVAVNNDGNGTPYVSGPEQWDGNSVHLNKWTTAPGRVAPAGTIFITVKGSGVGTLFPGVSAAIGRDIYAFEPHASVSFRFVYRALQLSINDVIGKARGDIPGLSKDHILQHPITIPGPLTQERVASKIDELFSCIDEGERALERVQKLVERYRQAVLKAAVTGELTREWREKNKGKLESGEALLARILSARRDAWEKAELAKMKAKGIKPANDKWKQKYEEPSPPDRAGLSELPRGWTWASFGQLVWLSQNGISKRAGDSGREVNVLRLADISGGRIESSSPRSIRLSEDEVDRYLLEVGDLLCVRVNGSRNLTGRLVPVAANEEWAYCDHFIRFRPVPSLVSSLFLDVCFDAGHSRSVVESKMVTTAGQNTVSQGSLFAVPIPLPPLAEQEVLLSEVERRIYQVDRNIRDISVVQKSSSALRQTVLRSAFSGSLVAQHVGDVAASAILERIATERDTDGVAQNRRRKKKTRT